MPMSMRKRVQRRHGGKEKSAQMGYLRFFCIGKDPGWEASLEASIKPPLFLLTMSVAQDKVAILVLALLPYLLDETVLEAERHNVRDNH